MTHVRYSYEIKEDYRGFYIEAHLCLLCNGPPDSFLHIYDRAYFVRFERRHAERMTTAQQALNKKFFIIDALSIFDDQDFATELSFVPSSLIEIYKFSNMVSMYERRNAQDLLVFAAGTNQAVQRKTAFLVGCHLIMSKSLDAQQVLEVFNVLHDLLNKKYEEVSAMDCWQALYQAKSLAWLTFSDPLEQSSHDAGTIDMDELIHYARCDID